MKLSRFIPALISLVCLSCSLVSTVASTPTPAALSPTAAPLPVAPPTAAARAVSAATSTPFALPLSGPVTPVSGHPRLWLRAEDLTRLRAWAVGTNPVYQDGLLPVVEAAKTDMDQGNVPGKDARTVTYVDYPSEMYAELFAFMALIGPASDRDAYAQRARTVLMHVINAAAATLIQSDSGTPFAGAAVANTLVLFPVTLNTAFTSLAYTAPANLTTHLIIGLSPNTGYAVAVQAAGDKVSLTISPGQGYTTDGGGVLVWEAKP